MFYHNILKKEKISGIFSSPPYLGLIDYHEQHAYDNELLKCFENIGIKMRDEIDTYFKNFINRKIEMDK